jgi:hypothetical protein
MQGVIIEILHSQIKHPEPKETDPDIYKQSIGISAFDRMGRCQ